MSHLCIRNVLVGIFAAIAMSACAGNGRRADASSPEQQAIAHAADAIKEAESGGAYEQGGADLNRAREKLAKAQDAAEDGDEEIAERLAVEAALDAEVAAATARNQEMQAALSELQESIRTLQDEIRRNEQRNQDQGRL
jgi:chromosome segregation ATPase